LRRGTSAGDDDLSIGNADLAATGLAADAAIARAVRTTATATGIAASAAWLLRGAACIACAATAACAVRAGRTCTASASATRSTRTT
jgi:hypothetical protein